LISFVQKSDGPTIVCVCELKALVTVTIICNGMGENKNKTNA